MKPKWNQIHSVWNIYRPNYHLSRELTEENFYPSYKQIILFIFNSGSTKQGDHFSQTKKKSEKPVIDIIDFK